MSPPPLATSLYTAPGWHTELNRIESKYQNAIRMHANASIRTRRIYALRLKKHRLVEAEK